jgi:hypothetical protein
VSPPSPWWPRLADTQARHVLKKKKQLGDHDSKAQQRARRRHWDEDDAESARRRDWAIERPAVAQAGNLYQSPSNEQQSGVVLVVVVQSATCYLTWRAPFLIFWAKTLSKIENNVQTLQLSGFINNCWKTPEHWFD